MKSTRIATAIKGLMQARASGKLNVILNVTPQILSLPHDKSVDAKIVKVSPTGEIILNTSEGEIKILTSKKMQEGQDFKLSTAKNNGGFELILKSKNTGEETHLKMPGDFKKMLSDGASQVPIPNAPRYAKPQLAPGYRTPNSQLPNTSLFSFLTFMDRKSVANELHAADASRFIPDLNSSDFINKIAKMIKSDSDFYEKFGGLEYVHNMRAATHALSTEAWKFFCIPLKFQEHVHQMKLIIEDRDREEEGGFAGARKFWIEINPDKLGRIQIDGVYTGQKGNTKTLLNLSSERPMSDDLKMELSFSARTLMKSNNINLVLNFVDYTERREDAFQVLLENYCRNRVSEVYA